MNRAIIAAAGSRKTQEVVNFALSVDDSNVLIVTYTNRNRREIERRIEAERGLVPRHIEIAGWFDFLMRDLVRPYQSAVVGEISFLTGLNFKGKTPRGTRKDDPRRYFFDPEQRVYRNGASDFAVVANEATEGRVVARLESIYSHILIDEFQDMVGFDLDVLDLLLQSSVDVMMVGDPRQFLIETNTSSRNKKYEGVGLLKWLDERTSACDLEERTVSYRSNQEICDLADSLFPDLPDTQSAQERVTGHDGVFEIKESEVVEYFHSHADCCEVAVLRWDKRRDTLGLPASNIGVAKGSTVDRVILFPTKPMLEFWDRRDAAQMKSPESLYVALTRARYSVDIVIPD